MVDSKDAIAFHPGSTHSGVNGETNWRSIDDHLCLATAMRRASAYCRADRRACSCDGGEAMTCGIPTWVAHASRLLASASSRSRAFVATASRPALTRFKENLDSERRRNKHARRLRP